MSRSVSTDVRVAAADAVASVFSGHSLDTELQRVSEDLPEREHALLRTIVMGTVCEHARLSAMIVKMVPKPPRPNSAVHALLAIGLYQLINMRTADHASVNETVNATSAMGHAPARGLVNAVLRRYLRERAQIEQGLDDDPVSRWSYPHWMIEQIRNDWPAQWETILEAGNIRPPMTLRVNVLQASKDSYQSLLEEHGQAAQAVPGVASALRLDQPTSVQTLPGYSAGAFAVQDASAQLAAVLLAPQPGDRVLDACAAPGGKTCHLLEVQPDVNLFALDKDPYRTRRIRENLDRLQLRATILHGDGCQPDGWWDGQSYDRILLDAPCTGSGVIRRHPDIKWLRRPNDVAQLAKTQLSLLRSLWALLKPGGQLLYSTCSIFQAEGDGVIGKFLGLRADVRALPMDTAIGEPCTHGRRIAPGDAFDGFYYALLGKA